MTYYIIYLLYYTIHTTGMTGAQIERAKANERNDNSSSGKKKKKLLYSDEYTEFMEIIKNISLSRVCIKEAMGFAYDKVEAAEEVIIMTFYYIYEYFFVSLCTMNVYPTYTVYIYTVYTCDLLFYISKYLLYHVYDIDR